MSAIESHAHDSVALQLAAALDQYEALTQETLAAWPDLERYRAMSDQVEQLRLYSAGLPQLRVQWVKLLIAHAELVHFLWRLQYGPAQAVHEQIAPVRDHHADCIAELRDHCLRLLGRSPEPQDGAAPARS
jgi:hypothetical protein